MRTCCAVMLHDSLQSSSSERTTIGGLCFDITELVRSISDFKIHWVCREANSVADHCAQLVSASERYFFFKIMINESSVVLKKKD